MRERTTKNTHIVDTGPIGTCLKVRTNHFHRVNVAKGAKPSKVARLDLQSKEPDSYD